MSTDQRDALEETGVVQRHVVTKYRDGHVNVEDVTATHPADLRRGRTVPFTM